MMAQIDPRQLLAAAMASGGSGAVPPDSMPPPGAAGGAAGAPTGPQGGLQDSLPAEFAGAQPVGAENSGVLSTGQLQQQVLGAGAEPQPQAGGGAAQELIGAIQSPTVPPDQKRMAQQQLQLAALRSLTAGPSGAVGSPQG